MDRVRSHPLLDIEEFRDRSDGAFVGRRRHDGLSHAVEDFARG